MAVLEILKLPDERLKQVSEPVVEFDDALHRFVADLEETRQNGPAAVGIAALLRQRLNLFLQAL